MNTEQKAREWLSDASKVSLTDCEIRTAEIITALLAERQALLEALILCEEALEDGQWSETKRIAQQAIAMCEESKP